MELEMPRPAREEALLRVVRCGICGSDLHGYRGRWGSAGGVGHEFCALVEACGEDAGHLEIGARVVGECFAHCGQCEQCRRGSYNQCEAICYSPGRPAGAMAEFQTYPVRSLYVVPDSLSHEDAAMVEPTAVAFRAVSRAGVREGESVAVVGGGTIGLLCASVAAALGASVVFLLAKHPHQAEKAEQLGVARPLLAAEGDPRKVVGERTAGRGVDVAIDAVAAGTSLTTALALVAKGGRLVEVGGATRPLMVAVGPLVDNEIAVTGSSCYAMTSGRHDFEWALELIADGRVRAAALVTHTFPLAQLAEAFRTAADKRTGSIKVMLTMDS